MLRRSSPAKSLRVSDYSITKLAEDIRVGVEALKNPDVELCVRNYFETNPHYSRDLIHIAAVASRMGAEADQPKRLAREVARPISRSV